MNFADTDLFITLAVNDIAPINGMYVLYTDTPDSAIPSLTDEGITSLDGLKEYVSAQGVSMGLIRTFGVSPHTITPNATTTFYATTANAEHVRGLQFTAGVYARVVMLAHLDNCHADKDTALDYNILSTPPVLPANGAITLIDKVTAE